MMLLFRQLSLGVAAIAAIGLAIGLAFDGPVAWKASAVTLAVSLSIGIGAITGLRGYQYTLWIVTAVVSAMIFPNAFLRWGPIDLRNKIVLLVIVQLVMFGMGTQMSVRDFAGVARMPRGVIVGIVSQFTIMPLVGFALTKLFAFPPEVSAGIVLIGACSSGLASNVMTYLAQANLALSVTLTTFATLLAPLMTPLWMKVLAGQYVQIEFLGMMTEIVKIVLVPVGAALLHDYLKFASPAGRKVTLFVGGIGLAYIVVAALLRERANLVSILISFLFGAVVTAIVYHHLTRRLPWLDKSMPRVSMFGIIYFTAVTTAVGRNNLLAVGAMLFVAAVMHNAFGYVLGYGFGRLTGLNRSDARTIAIEVGLQNGGMAAGIAASMGKLGTVGLAAAIFSPWMNVSGSILANYWRRKPVNEPAPEHPPAKRTDTMKSTSSGVLTCVAFLTAIGLMADSAHAQYPQVPGDIQRAADEAKAAADKASDDAFVKAMPAIEEWATKGKPYLPGAAKPEDLPQATIPAFPGAEGGGMHSFGGRGGRVFVVTSLDDSGPGSLREACDAGGPRIVVFNIAGIIQLKDRIRIRAPYITINGGSAPGDGVCIAGNTFELETHDVIIRHMRFRRGAMNAGDRNDSIGGNPTGNIMIDHVSASWGLDENMSMYRHMYDHDSDAATPDFKLPTVNITIQNSIFSECLNTFNHAFGSTIGGHNSTFMRNLWASNSGRNPSVGMDGDFTLANNVIFNWRHRTTDGGDHRSLYNIINNYLKPGPATPNGPIAYRFLKPEARRGKNIPREYGKAYVHGNIAEGNEAVTNDNWAGGVQLDGEASEAEWLPRIRVDEPIKHAPITIVPAREAYDLVLKNAGATLPKRDAVDVRIIESVRTGTPTAKPEPDLAEKLGHVRFSAERIAEMVALVEKGIITDPAQVGGYPKYEGTPYADADNDGMPDDWETKHGLNPDDASDASADKDGNGYTNIEDFLNNIGKAS